MWSLSPWKKREAGNGGTLTASPIEREFLRIREEFDHLLEQLFHGGPAATFGGGHHWGVQLDETDTHYVACIEAPGFETEDFDIQASDDQLIIKAEHKETQQKGDGKEGSSYRYGSFRQTLSLPPGAKIDQIEAKYHSGVLELRIPKGEESQNVKRIPVKSE